MNTNVCNICRVIVPVAASSDPWGGSGAAPPPGASNGTVTKGLDDEFDMLSSRSKSPTTTSGTAAIGSMSLGGGLDSTEPEIEDLFGLGAAAAALSGGGTQWQILTTPDIIL